jgi:hypothetical protein
MPRLTERRDAEIDENMRAVDNGPRVVYGVVGKISKRCEIFRAEAFEPGARTLSLEP